MTFLSSSVQRILPQRVVRLWQHRYLPRLAQQTCELYLDGQNPQAQTHCREILQTQVSLDAQTLTRLLHTDIGEALLKRLGQLMKLPKNAVGQQALVQQLIQADQLSILELLYQLAGNLNIDQVLTTAQKLKLLLATADELLTLLADLMEQESVGQVLPAVDPRLPGPWGVRQRILSLHRRSAQPFQVYLYEPLGDRVSPIPVIVISHGLAAHPQAMAPYAHHLVSHGYLVAVPQHPGSDIHQVHNLISGRVDEVFALREFFDRPQDVSAVLDRLEELNPREYGGQLTLNKVGVLGKSFGGYTALALAGGKIDFETLAQRCGGLSDSLNVSLLLQCRALSLTPTVTALQDPRVQAIFTVDPIGSGLFGVDGLATVTIPTLIVTGSSDKTAPMALEPMQLFPKLKSPDRFLAVIRGKSHIHDTGTLLSSLKLMGQTELPSLTLSPPIIDSYLKGLSVLFFEQYLQTLAPIPRCLSAYAQSISRSPCDLSLISEQSDHALSPVLENLQQQLSQT